MRRKKGYIDVDKMLQDIGVDTTNIRTIMNDSKVSVITDEDWEMRKIVFSFNYDNDIYYYKYSSISDPYNELIASELANDFNLPYIDYDLASVKDKCGVISKDFKKKDIVYLSGTDILENCFKKLDNTENYNNLEDIWSALEYHYQNHPNKKEIVKDLMDKIINIYIFDIVTCQSDRHSGNWGIIEDNEKIDIQPIFDNERILSINNFFSCIRLSVNKNEFSLSMPDLIDFLTVSSYEYISLIEDKMLVISEDNLKSIFKRIEDKTGFSMPVDKKEHYLKEYEKHRNKLEKTLKQYLERNDKYEGKNR